MANVLFTWEFGGGLGHLRRFLPIAAELKKVGHKIAIAAPNPKEVQAELTALAEPGTDYQLLQARSWQPPNNPRIREIPTHTFADVLHLFGYYQADRLVDYIAQWRQMIDRLKPDLIVSDFSPSVALAARDRVRRLVVGNGYTVPPAGQLLPPMRPWVSEVQPYSRIHEGEALAAFNSVAQKFKDPAIDYFGDLFSGHQTFVCSIDEFDPYAAYREQTDHFPFNIDIPRSGGKVEGRSGPPVVAYLPGNHTQLENIIRGMTGSGLLCEVYISGAPKKITSWAGENVRLHDKPLDLKNLLPETKLLIHHAGLGTALAGLLAGTPQFVLSQNLEHFITARGLLTFGASVHQARTDNRSADEIANAIRNISSNRDILDAAETAAENIAHRAHMDTLGAITAQAKAELS